MLRYKHVLLALLWLLAFASPGVAFSQTGGSYSYFNEWYQSGQDYIKLRLAKDGFYRVSLNDLSNAGVNVSTLNPSDVQIFYRGQEIPLRMVTNGSQLDYFEFLGLRNDGRLDSMIYRTVNPPFRSDPTQQTNRFSSLFTDTTAYFVTWNGGVAVPNRVSTISPNNYSSYNAEPWYRYRSLQEHPDFYFPGGGSNNNAYHVLNPDYVSGEGFIGKGFEIGGYEEYSLSTPGFANSGSPSKVMSRVVSTTTTNQHILSIRVNGTELSRDTTANINIGTREFTTTQNLSNTTLIRFVPLGAGTGPDRGSSCWDLIEYDRIFDLVDSSHTILREWTRTDSTYLRFYNAKVGSEAWLMDPVTKQVIEGTVSGDSLHFLVPGYPGPRDLYVYTDSSLATPTIVPNPSLSNLSDPSSGAEFVIITHRKFSNSAEKYAQYRDTCEVNKLSSRVVYIDDIYDEFGYGSMTPWAIKNFCKYAMDEWTVRPQFFLLWGKGRPAPKEDNRHNFVPTFGEPANDYEYVSNFDPINPSVTPEAAIGRVAIYEDSEGLTYLDKVDDYEHMPYEPWMKEAVFLGGGKTTSEQNAINFAMKDIFSPYVVDSPMGGKIFSYQSFNTGNLSNTELTSEEAINQGAALIHFFGHSGTNIFDVDILEARLYQNLKRYPFMVAFGCYGGDFNNLTASFGERFILEPNKGSIGYLANSTAGFLQQLRIFGDDFYGELFGGSYGKPIGVVMQKTIEEFAVSGNYLGNILTVNHAKQMNLQGDPSVVLRFPIKPDLRITDSDVFFDPESLSALDNEYALNLIVHNDGRTFSDSFQLTIGHRTSEGNVINYPPQQFAPVDLLDTITYPILNTLGPALAGVNEYDIFIDALDTLDEYLEPNNRLSHEVVIQGNVPAIISPYEYAIIDQNRTALSASTFIITRTDGLAYEFEIDTLFDFTSGFRQGSGRVVGSAAFASWDVSFDLLPNQVYYWRVRLADVYPVQWNESSFKYIPGKLGWSQGDEPQFFKDPTDQITMDQTNQFWTFDQFYFQLHSFIQSLNNDNPEYFMGPYGSNGFPSAGVCYTSFDQHTLKPSFLNLPLGDWGFVSAPSPGQFVNDPITMLVEHITSTPDGDHYLLTTAKNPLFSNWRPEWFQALELIGVSAAQVEGLVNGDQFIVFGRKGGAPGSATVIREPNLVIGSGPPTQLDLLMNLEGTFESAQISSTLIGPSDSWTSVDKDWVSLDPFIQEDLLTKVYGVRRDKTEALLFNNLESGEHQIGSINAQEFPFLRLEAEPTDPVFHTAPQLDYWEVYYQPAPDATVDPVSYFSIPDTIQEGQIVNIKIGARNVSDYDMDSLLVRYTFQRSDRSSRIIGEKRFATLPAHEVQELNFEFHSAGWDLEGLSTMIIEINPDLDQVEHNEFNNFYFHRVFVETDGVGPILDVTVDGKHLMEGDIVSPNPEIVIQLNDENPYLPVTISDTTYKIWFGTERTFQLNSQILIEGNTDIEESIGLLPENKAQLIFRPGELIDGEYTLAVQGYDFTGNESAKGEYVIHFEVVNEKAISKVLPYPNPFSSSTRWVYTLTGGEMPYVFEIRIYTITGRLVRIIDLLGNEDVFVGRNVSETIWDGTDEFGDQLANGIYIYKAHVKFRDRFGVNERDEGIDDFFNKNGFGKVYLMR